MGSPWNDATKYFRIISVAFWIYDWALTFPAEMRLYRKQKWWRPSLASILLILVRYLGGIALTANVMGFLGRFWEQTTCKHFFRVILVTQCLASFASHVVFIVRTVAICNNSMKTLVKLGVIGVITCFLEIFSQLWSFQHYRVGSAGNCVTAYFDPPETKKNVAWLYYLASVIFDVIILFVTYRGLAIDYTNRHRGRPQSGSSTFTDVLWGSSLVYFVATTVFNLINLVFYAHFKTSSNSTVFCTLGIAITSMMSGRVILNLHDYAHNHVPQSFHVSEYQPGFPRARPSPAPAGSYNLTELRSADLGPPEDELGPQDDIDDMDNKRAPVVLEDDLGLNPSRSGWSRSHTQDSKARDIV